MNSGSALERMMSRAVIILQEAEYLEEKEAWNMVVASISRLLRAEREISFYGDEQSGVPPESLYTREDALEALSKAQEVLSECQKLIETAEGCS